jgi:hypothetical protein
MTDESDSFTRKDIILLVISFLVSFVSSVSASIVIGEGRFADVRISGLQIIWLIVSLIFLVVSAIVSILKWRSIRKILQSLWPKIRSFFAMHWQLLLAFMIIAAVNYGVYAFTESLWLVLLAIGFSIGNAFLTLWLCGLLYTDERPLFKKHQPEILFHDVFDSFDGWNDFKNGQVTHTSEQAHIGSHSLKKSGANDPHGGFKEIGQEIGRGFVFSGWVYSPVGRSGEADRLAIEDHHFNGYGFAVDRKAHTMFIEQRHEGNRNEDKPLSPPKQLGTSFLECWYHFELVVEAKRLRLRLYDPDSGTQISTPWVRDNQFSSFDRVVVHGGRPYYVDDLKIEKH